MPGWPYLQLTLLVGCKVAVMLLMCFVLSFAVNLVAFYMHVYSSEYTESISSPANPVLHCDRLAIALNTMMVTAPGKGFVFP